MDTKEDFNDYDNRIVDIDEVIGTDVKINPDYYIHSALIKAQQALIKDDVKGGFMQFRVIVEHIEILTRAANMLTPKYAEEVDKYKKTDEYSKEEDNFVRLTKLANKKLELLLIEVFANKVSTEPMKI
jgi:Na+-transporting NADH:ubiquinone oxidoreductase subunit NqrF